MRAIIDRLVSAIRRTIYGAPRRQGAHRFIIAQANNRLFLPVVVLPVLYGIGLCAILMLVDPYDLRPWGLSPRLTRQSYPTIEKVNLVRVYVNTPHDLILLGSSTAMPFTEEQLDAAFGYKSSVNLSYEALMPPDASRVLTAAVDTPGLKRLMIGIDYVQMRADDKMEYLGRGAIASLTNQWFDMPDFTLPVVRASLHRLKGDNFDVPEWRPEVDKLYDAPAVTTRPDIMAMLDDSVAHPDPAIFEPAPVRTCSSYPFIDRVLLPVGRAAMIRKIHVDLLFPPVPFQSYYNWQKHPYSQYYPSWGTGSHYRQLVDFYQCVVEAVAANGLPNVTAHALDADPRLTQITDFRDTIHLTRPDALRRALSAIRNGDDVVTPTTFATYRKAMDQGVANARSWRWSPVK
ncbi:hypothetical protein [Sphingomonas mali]|uniref:hypothetical protein n=1 Tax=Sphingomonas mali TaxID=40682 RepID=UPI00082BECC8|nr:hypothetical protein [Sphingomonas mali]